MRTEYPTPWASAAFEDLENIVEDGGLNLVIDAAAGHAGEGGAGEDAVIVLHALIVHRAGFKPAATALVE